MAKRSLIIGIDKYESEEISNLNGCVNDARLFWSVLSEHFKFKDKPGQHWFLSSSRKKNRDERVPDRQTILQAFDEVIEATKKGDTVVIYYAGHGSLVADRDRDEDDGTDSTIVPFDAKRWSSAEEYADDSVLDITDDEIHVKLLRLAEKKAEIVMVFDSCHSGTISRGKVRARTIPRDPRTRDQIAPTQFSDEERKLLRESVPNSAGMLSAKGFVLIAGCRDDQESQEIPVPGGGTNGNLTFHLCEALVGAKKDSTYGEVFQQIAGRVTTAARKLNRVQDPQIDGNTEGSLFGATDVPALAYVRIASDPFEAEHDGRVTRMVELAGGAAFGLRVGSRWAVVPNGATNMDTRLGELVITEVNPNSLTSTARIESESSVGDVAKDTWAIEVERDFGDDRMKVTMKATTEGNEAWSMLRAEIMQEETLAVVDGEPEEPVVSVVLVGEGAVPEELGLSATASFNAPTILVLSEADEFMMPPKLMSQRSDVLRNLKRWATYRHRVDIENPNSPLASEVTLDVTKVGESESLQAPGSEGLPVLNVGDRAQIRITNNGTESVYVNMLTFEINGAITHTGESGAIEAGTDWAVETEPLVWTAEFPFAPNPYKESPTSGIEIWKFFLTRHPVSVSSVVQKSASRGRKPKAKAAESTSEMEALFAGAGMGRGEQGPTEHLWGTLEFRFALTPITSGEADDQHSLQLQSTTVRPTGGAVEVKAGGKVRFNGLDRRPQWTQDSPAGKLRAFFEGQELRRVQSFTVGDPESAPARGHAARVDLTPKALDEPGWGEFMMSTDDQGLVRWHLPMQEQDEADQTDASSPPASPPRYEISRPTIDASDAQTSRGPLGAFVGKLIVDRFAFPLLTPLVDQALNVWERTLRPNQLRWLSEEDFRDPNRDPRFVGGEGWSELAGGTSLLLLHGPLSRSHKAFAGLSDGFLPHLRQKYGNRVFGFDHTTLSEDPLENVQWFLSQLPPRVRLDMDIVAHSRGGLVARALAERGHEFAENGSAVNVGRVILAGSPNAGTPLADPSHIDTLLSIYTNLLSLIDPTEVLGPIVQLVQKLAAGALKDLRGLQAMAPGSEFLGSLPGPAQCGAQYFGLSSDISSAQDTFLRKLMERIAAGVVGGDANDFVVSQASAWGDLPFVERTPLGGADATSHLGYFESTMVREQIGSWLGRESAPIYVHSRAPVPPGTSGRWIGDYPMRPPRPPR